MATLYYKNGNSFQQLTIADLGVDLSSKLDKVATTTTYDQLYSKAANGSQAMRNINNQNGIYSGSNDIITGDGIYNYTKIVEANGYLKGNASAATSGGSFVWWGAKAGIGVCICNYRTTTTAAETVLGTVPEAYRPSFQFVVALSEEPNTRGSDPILRIRQTGVVTLETYTKLVSTASYFSGVITWFY